MAWTKGSCGTVVGPFYFPEGNAAGINVYVLN